MIFFVTGASRGLGRRVVATARDRGGMRTGWAGASMAMPPISEPYEATVGASARAMADFEEHANGDPRKVAALDDPPLRLPAGSDACELSRSTDPESADGAWRGQRGASLPDVRA
ncbi:hypothetical protein MUY14_20015 [Amycolatopsis sp. FBCC-B4732]|uniref:hypothetical protein n=1 Tax=Amycolatopsis sp. FBCC-B4732 TaxID=3079339 RepID=UPI001FF4D3BD|nr:hypothetical protein [Amycolatopsis sp. FBCC-B4732]UOX92796.1 hypothetical protein MUY14_20015 [Amycolatopsis sp. FBCC-B4732]